MRYNVFILFLKEKHNLKGPSFTGNTFFEYVMLICCCGRAHTGHSITYPTNRFLTMSHRLCESLSPFAVSIHVEGNVRKLFKGMIMFMDSLVAYLLFLAAI